MASAWGAEPGWSMWRSASIIRGEWPAGPTDGEPAHTTLSISSDAGLVYLLSIASEDWKVAEHQKLSVAFGFDNGEPSKVKDLAHGYAESGQLGPGFIAGVDAAFLRRMAGATTMEIYSEGHEPISLDFGGAGEAVDRLMTCADMRLAEIRSDAK